MRSRADAIRFNSWSASRSDQWSSVAKTEPDSEPDVLNFFFEVEAET
jgi:hypothetical protein